MYNDPTMDIKKMTKKPLNKDKKPLKIGSQLITAVLIFMAITALYSILSGSPSEVKKYAISDIAKSVQKGEVTKIVVAGEDVNLEMKDGTKATAKKEPESALSDTLVRYGVTVEQLANTPIEIKNESGFGYWILNILPFALPVLMVLFLVWMLTRQVKGQGMQAMNFGQSKARITTPDDKKNKVVFKDVAGNKEAKIELEEIVDFLRNPKKFLDIGAQIPKGVMLTGAPGTGKTLLARAVAGEAGVPFFHLSGSEFVEMFVGVGASRVRDLFKMAKKASPSIVFIDEIDAVGRVRGTGTGGGNDEREQTLNQILVEMDGFEPTEKVIVMAATNRSDVLDPALLRPGRFDRRVKLDLPDRKDREEIMAIHSRKKPLESDVNIKLIAERTPGFSGADLYSLMNEAAILAAREDRKRVAQMDIIKSIEKVMMGPERKSHLMSKEEKRITAYHEAGHALVASMLPNADPVHKVTIVSRGSAGGYTLKLPLDDRKLQSKKEFIDDLAMSMGGYAAEQMVFGDITTGPSNDLQVATNLARAMVTRWGMSDAIGPVAVESDNPRYQNEEGLPPAVANIIGEEVKMIMTNALATAKRVITEKREVLDAIANKLIEVETLEQDEYNKLIMSHGIKPRTKEVEEIK